MNKLLNSIIFFLISSLSIAQVENDSLIIKKYYYDTLHFNSFPNAILFDSIITDKKFPYFELNTNIQGTRFQNLYRSVKYLKSLNDSLIISKTNKGFGTFCPPDGCFWYISAKTKDDEIWNIDDLEKLKIFIPILENKFNALLWLYTQYIADSRGIPIEISRQIKYKKIQNGFLILLPGLQVSDCPVTKADVMYFVRTDGKVVRIKSTIISKSKACI